MRGIGERALPHDAPVFRGVLSDLRAVTVAGLAISAACVRFVPASTLIVQWKLTPAAPVVNADTIAEVTILDQSRRPVKGAAFRVEAFMTHPGMAPVLETATPTSDGVQSIRLRFTMAGEWILSVKDEQGIRVQGSEFRVLVRVSGP